MSPIRTSITRHANGSVISSRITYSVDNYGVSELGNIRLAIEGKPYTGNSSSGPILLSGTVDGEAQGASGAGNRRFTYQTIDGGSACTFADISFEIVNGKLSVLGQSFSVDARPTLIVVDDEGSIAGVVDLSEVNVAGDQIGNSTPANQPPVFSVTTDRRERIRQMHKRSLRRQYRRGGLRAVLERTDNPIVNDLDLENPEEVKAQLDRAESNATAAIGKLNRELSALADAYRTKAEEALQQEMNAVLENLGDDGARLRALVSKMSTERPHLVPNDKPKLIKDGFVSAVMNSLENNGLDLSEKQRDLIHAQYAPYAQWRRDFVNDSLGVRGPGPDPEIFGVPEKDLSSEAVALLLDEERALEQRMRDLLISRQIEKAESMVLNERYRLEGLHAVLDCTEFRAIKDLQFEASIEDIKLSVQCAVASSLWQCEELLIELLQFDHGFAERVDEIKRREAEAVLDQLGADGEKLRALIAEWN
jgi:hypothetical protein